MNDISAQTDRPAPDGVWMPEQTPKRWHVLTIAAVLAVVYLFGTGPKWWPTPDSALYQGLARSLAAGDGYVFNGEVSTRVTPGLPVILAGLRLAFGDSFWPGNLLMVACGLGALAMAYLTLSRVGDRRMALAAVLASGLTYTFFSNTHLILTDAPFALLLWVALYAAVRFQQGARAWLAAAVAAVIVGVVVRAPGVMILAPAGVGLLVERATGATRGRRVAAGAGVLGAVAATAGTLLAVAALVGDRTPAYVERSLESESPGLVGRLGEIGVGILRLPEVLAELLTSQEGLIPLGAIALVLAIVGGVVLWRRGERLGPVTVLLFQCGMFLIKSGENAAKARYLMPVAPIIVYLGMTGLCWCVWRVGRARGDRPAGRTYLTAVTIFAGVMIAINLPRLGRNAFYYGALAHTDRYYEVIRDRDFADLFQAAEAVRENCPPGVTVAVDGDQVSILHFLTARRVEGMPRLAQRGRDGAEAMFAFIRDGDYCSVVVDVRKSRGGARGAAFLERFAEMMDAAGAELLHTGERYAVYRLPPDPPTPPTRPPGDGRGG